MIQDPSTMCPMYWWMGQVVDESYWKSNVSDTVIDRKEEPGYGFRYKCRIFGRDAKTKEFVPDDQLEWIPAILPITAGGGNGGSSASANIKQGNYVVGYYLDGIEGTQPIITGVLPNSGETSFFGGDPPENFTPRTGFKGKSGDRIVSSNFINLYGPTSLAQIDSAGTQAANVTIQYQATDGLTKSYSIPKPKACEAPSEQMKGIQLHIRNLISFFNRVKAEYGSFYAGATNLMNQITSIINDTAFFISKLMKTILGKVRTYIVSLFNLALKKLIELIPPQYRLGVSELNKQANSTLQCVFNKIISNLINLITATLKALIDKFINAPLCAVENLVGSLFSDIFGEISGAISQVTSLMSGALGAINNIAGQVFAALDVLTGILKFLLCDEDVNCTMGDTWTFWGGLAKDATQIRAGIGSFYSGVINSVSSGITTESIIPCNTAAIPCSPPRISITGGGGVGAFANPVVSATGAILGIDVLNGGSGYSSIPAVNITDDCGLGGGAVAIPLLQPRDRDLTNAGLTNTLSNFNVTAGGPRGTGLGPIVGLFNGTNTPTSNYAIRDQNISSQSNVGIGSTAIATSVGIGTTNTSSITRKTLISDIDLKPLTIGGIGGNVITYDNGLLAAGDKISVETKNPQLTKAINSLASINTAIESVNSASSLLPIIQSGPAPTPENTPTTTNTTEPTIPQIPQDSIEILRNRTFNNIGAINILKNTNFYTATESEISSINTLLTNIDSNFKSLIEELNLSSISPEVVPLTSAPTQ